MLFGTEHDHFDVLISTESACSLSDFPSDAVDHIFTDPPYGGTIQYGELSSVWTAWLNSSINWLQDEITINDARGISEFDWERMMRQAMSKCYRVLKPGRWLALCYHDTSDGTWALIQDMMAEVGFIADKPDNAYLSTLVKKLTISIPRTR